VASFVIAALSVAITEFLFRQWDRRRHRHASGQRAT
jgi:hypothetical protein